MPYPFAHPAAVLPLVRPMGRHAVPSALVIGSMVPDFWYFVPLVTRADSHSLAGLFLFCVPAGLVCYLTFHLVLKEPLTALLPRSAAARLAPFAAQRVPARPWTAVVLSLLVGALTHLAWDSFTHEEGFVVETFAPLRVQLFALGAYTVQAFQLVQHVSTVLGFAFVIWWAWRRLRSLPLEGSGVAIFSPARRILIVAALLAVSAGWAALDAVLPASLDPLALRSILRSAGLDAAQAFGVGVLAYCVATTWLRGRSRAPRSPAGR